MRFTAVYLERFSLPLQGKHYIIYNIYNEKVSQNIIISLKLGLNAI